MCIMLNSGGGVLLFDCVETGFNSAVVKGSLFSEKEKELYEQRLISYLDVFEPKAETRMSVKVSFVPVV